MNKYFWFTFADGYRVCARGFSKQELKIEELKHGKLIAKEDANETRTKDELKLLQNLPLEIKVAKTKLRIREWVDYYGTDGVYVSFSGGKDSTVLLHLVREMYTDIEAVFVNTGLEFPEIQQFVKTFDNVTILRPKMRFDEVIKKYGYPIISKAVADAVAKTRAIIANNGNMNCVRVRQLLGTYEYNGHKTKFDKSKYKPLIDVDFKVSDKCCMVMKKHQSSNGNTQTVKFQS